MKNMNLRNILIVVIAVVLVFAAVLVVQAISNNNDVASQPAVNDSQDNEDMTDENEQSSEFQGDAYNFRLLDTNGNVHSLEQYAGKKVYLKFWATWCPSCIAGLGELEELHMETADRDDIVVLSVVAPGYSGEKSKEKFIEWYEGQELKHTVLLDEGGITFFEYGIRAVPSSFYIDTKGNLADTKLGHASNEEIYEKLEPLQ